MICRNCNPVTPPQHTERFPHHELALTVRRMKGLVLASIAFGIVVAPVAVWVATKALHRHASSSSTDQADLRQLVLMKRLSIGLLIFWAFALGGEVAWLYAQGG